MWHRDLISSIAAIEDRARDSDVGTFTRTAKIHPTAILDDSQGPIVLGQGTRVCPGAHLVGPLFIGSNCLIGNNAIVRGPARIGHGVQIGAMTEVKKSVIDDNVSIGPMCFVADSVVEKEVFLGAMVRTSNYRLDRKTISTRSANGVITDSGLTKLGAYIGWQASLGVGCVILPGRLILPGTQFGPGIQITKNLPRGTYTLKQEVTFIPH